MRDFWKDLEGGVCGSYRLLELLGATTDSAVYSTEHGSPDQHAAIKLISADLPDAERRWSAWSAALAFSHPNILPILDVGKCEIDGHSILYAVTEKADENLAGVLAERPLSESEARDMLGPLLDGLSYLHRAGFLHSSLKPSNVLACDDALKLSSDSLLRMDDVPPQREYTPYDPPEWFRGQTGTAGDLWSLGTLLAYALTLRMPDSATRAGLPEPFADIVNRCRRADPDERWTIPQISACLSGRMPADVVSAPEAEPVAHPVEKRLRQWAVPVVAGLLAIVLTVWIAGRFTRSASPPAAPPAVAPKTVTETPAQAPAQLPLPRTSIPAPARAAKTRQGPSWFVVVASYSRSADAQKRTHDLNRRYPRFHFAVHAPSSQNPHYLVIAGSYPSVDAAVALKKRARAAGLPRDVYVRRLDLR